jgi:hypothetical protein
VTSAAVTSLRPGRLRRSRRCLGGGVTETERRTPFISFANARHASAERSQLTVENKRAANFCQTIRQNATSDTDPICARKLPRHPVILPNWNQAARTVPKLTNRTADSLARIATVMPLGAAHRTVVRNAYQGSSIANGKSAVHLRQAASVRRSDISSPVCACVPTDGTIPPRQQGRPQVSVLALRASETLSTQLGTVPTPLYRRFPNLSVEVFNLGQMADVFQLQAKLMGSFSDYRDYAGQFGCAGRRTFAARASSQRTAKHTDANRELQ